METEFFYSNTFTALILHYLKYIFHSKLVYICIHVKFTHV
jgi:hypothetical protein